jgi:hypothetical protein
MTVSAAVVAVVLLGQPALASENLSQPASPFCAVESIRTPWSVSFDAAAEPAESVAPSPLAIAIEGALTQAADQAAPGRRRVIAFEYSDGYKLRAKIHKIASIATLPLFIGEYLVGQKLYNNAGQRNDGNKGLHSGLAAATGVVFGINTVTGVWNLIEAAKDPNHKTKRTIHGILMLIADAGFVATGATAPDSEHGVIDNSRRNHRSLAIASMGVAALSYLIMLF